MTNKLNEKQKDRLKLDYLNGLSRSGLMKKYEIGNTQADNIVKPLTEIRDKISGLISKELKLNQELIALEEEKNATLDESSRKVVDNQVAKRMQHFDFLMTSILQTQHQANAIMNEVTTTLGNKKTTTKEKKAQIALVDTLNKIATRNFKALFESRSLSVNNQTNVDTNIQRVIVRIPDGRND